MASWMTQPLQNAVQQTPEVLHIPAGSMSAHAYIRGELTVAHS